MVIKKASKQDLDQLFSVVKSCAKNLIEQGIFQWSENYPTKEILSSDIAFKQIWKIENETGIVGSIVLTEIEDPEYESCKMAHKKSEKPLHSSFGNSSRFSGKGICAKANGFCREICREK